MISPHRSSSLAIVAILAALTLLIGACADGGQEEAAPTSAPTTGTPGGEITLPIRPAPGAVERVIYAADEEIQGIRPDPTRRGPPDGAAFVMQTETGEIEGWYVTGGEFSSSSCRVASAENRFVVCSSYGPEATNTGYLVDRETEAVYQWDGDELLLAGAWSTRLLFEERMPSENGAQPTGRFTVVDDVLRTLSTFELRTSPADGTFYGSDMLLSPDNGRLAVQVGQQIRIVDLGSGSSRTIAEVPQTHEDHRLTWISLRITREGEEIVLVARYLSPEKTDPPTTGLPPQLLLRRYSWQGDQVGELSLMSKDARLSPDGRLIAWEEALHYDSVPILGIGSPVDWPAVVIADAATGAPRFRVKGATLCEGDVLPNYDADLRGNRWLADSSGVVVATRGGYQIASVAERTIEALPLADPADRFVEPSPDDPELFAVVGEGFAAAGPGPPSRVQLVDTSGTVRQTATLASSAGGLGHGDPWGSTGREVAFSIPHPDHHGTDLCGVGVAPPAKVELPPFDNSLNLELRGAEPCLNLRALPLAAGEVITCLPKGSPVTVTEASLTNVPGELSSLEPYVVSVYGNWAHVRAEAGQEGWVSSQYLDWAD